MHVDEPPAPGPLMQVVDVLRDQQKPAIVPGLEVRERPVRGVRLDARGKQRPAAAVVEPVNQVWIALECVGGRDFLYPVVFPQAVHTPEGSGSRVLRMPGDRERVRTYTTTAALHLLRLALTGEWWER